MEYISYTEFEKILKEKVQSGLEMYITLLETIIKNPDRYSGIFRLTNAKSKLMQNLTQSQEIKFGDFLEYIVTKYLEIKGFTNMNKKIISENNELNIDQYYKDNKKIYIIEQKVRDDHDSTKKRGQFDNFLKKYEAVTKNNPGKKVFGAMWFIDPALHKNKKFYQNQINANVRDKGYDLKLYYGEEYFSDFDMLDMWKELLNNLKLYRKNNDKSVISIPDFDDSEEILSVLLKMDDKLWNKLNSNNEKYNLLRSELFPNNNNINKAKKLRKDNNWK